MNLEDVVTAIELRDVYDGVSVWLMKDGTIVNRWAQGDWAGSRRYSATQDWIEANGALLRKQYGLSEGDHE